MVRYLVGTMIATAQNKMTKKEFKRLLAEPIKDAKIYKSPAKGLILKEILSYLLFYLLVVIMIISINLKFSFQKILQYQKQFKKLAQELLVSIEIRKLF